MPSLSPNAKQQFFTNAGVLAIGYKLYTYAAGTGYTTPQATYTDQAGSVPNANPITLDARGEAVIYLPDNLAYDYVLKDVLGNTIWTRDGVASPIQALSTQIASLPTSAGASGIGFLEPGTGAVLRTVQGRLQETVSVLDFMTDAQRVDVQTRAATLDVAAAFNAAVIYLGTVGGGVIHVPAGTYKIASMITMSSNGIVFQGDGFDTFHDTGSQVHATLIQWAGGADDAMFLFTSVPGASSKCITGCGVLDIAFNGNAGAAHVKSHIEIRSLRAGKFRFYGTDSSDWVLKIGVVAQLGEAEDTQYNHFDVWGRQFNTGGGGIQVAGTTDPSQVANTSFNQFGLVDLQINTGTGIQFGNSDTNFFDVVRITGVTTGKAYEFLGSNVSTLRCARGNFVRLLSSQGAGYARGTTTSTYPSISNYVGLDIGNATPYPTIETGATCYYSAAGKIQYGLAGAGAVLAGTVPDAVTQLGSLTNESVRIHNTSANHIRISDGTNEWGVFMNGGNLRIKLLAGAGTFGFGAWSGNADAAVNGYITIQDYNGNTRKLATIA